ncbi:Uncharacterized conserved protein YndB, AHSA1/START domain [Loktanella fryxellensis]|uniref:Uncharacterized conserved protein YndB, AHSA1/START domain n=1 Tax=Loktanella fryxellensis TaxID=245187 RepID=A0A1H8D778_9RHOB|nr:SRPBCC domain-containing protein [Loktanella fryxellensis]SEN02468.1 Uncharacterized conserved protein YndB, AHSA1/START domain [Loktanella fryxellensis]
MTNDTTLTFTRTLAASPAAVWRCWTEPDLIRQWFAPRPVVTTEVDIDPVPGGTFRTVMEVPGHGTVAGDAGCILVADPARRLVWTNALGPQFQPNRMGDGPMDFVFSAEIQIAPAPGGCTYTATVRHATPQAAAAHCDMGFFDGWGTATAQLEEVATAL